MEPPSREGFRAEFQRCWGALPDKAVLGVRLAAWVLLFQYYGWTTATVGRTGSLFAWMWDKWDDPANDASHGKLIPWVVLGVALVPARTAGRICRGIWWPGLPGLALALALHVVGFVVQQPRLSMVALFFGAWGLMGLVWGRETWKATFFPFVIFAFCVPMGGTFAQGLTLPLRQLAAKLTMFITKDLLEIEVTRIGTEGCWIPTLVGSFDVAAECSGIRSFLALLAISTIFSVLTMRSFWKRAIMIVLTVPLALVCNVMRITTIILAANTFRSQAAGKFVDNWFGYVTYGVAIGGFFCWAGGGREKPPGGAVMRTNKWVVFAVALGMMAATAGWLKEFRGRAHLGAPGVRVERASIYDDKNRLVSTQSVVLPANVLGIPSRPIPITTTELGALPRDTTFGRCYYRATALPSRSAWC